MDSGGGGGGGGEIPLYLPLYVTRQQSGSITGELRTKHQMEAYFSRGLGVGDMPLSPPPPSHTHTQYSGLRLNSGGFWQLVDYPKLVFKIPVK